MAKSKHEPSKGAWGGKRSASTGKRSSVTGVYETPVSRSGKITLAKAKSVVGSYLSQELPAKHK
jgi:hypothetical protein